MNATLGMRQNGYPPRARQRSSSSFMMCHVRGRGQVNCSNPSSPESSSTTSVAAGHRHGRRRVGAITGRRVRYMPPADRTTPMIRNPRNTLSSLVGNALLRCPYTTSFPSCMGATSARMRRYGPRLISTSPHLSGALMPDKGCNTVVSNLNRDGN
jgi:hypothetical protein